MLLPEVGKHAGSVEDRGDFNKLAPQPVDQAVGAHDELAKVGLAVLRNNTAEFRELDEAAGSGDQAETMSPAYSSEP